MNWPPFFVRLLYRINGVPRPIIDQHVERLGIEVWEEHKYSTDGYLSLDSARLVTKRAIEKWEDSWKLYYKKQKGK
jgi:hypothetical protein